MNSGSGNIAIAPATPDDLADLLRMIHREAEYERLSDGFAATEAALGAALFPAPPGRPAAEVLIARAGSEPVGFAVFFAIFSTFLAQPGLYMEDLFVEVAWRKHGVGRKLLARLAAIAIERHCHGISWSVLKWNENAIRFYRGIGAQQLDAWDHFSLTGAALDKMAAGAR